jgi:hypothetical protein
MKRTINFLQIIVLFCSLISQYCSGFDLCCQDMNVEVRAGVAPTFWTQRENFAAISCNAVSILQLPSVYVPLFNMPKFNKLFSVPWYLGLHVGYALCEDQEIYAELNYRQSHARTFTLNSLAIPNIDTISFSITPKNNYKIVDAYIGMRNYWRSCWCDAIELFLGAKVGFVHHSKVNFTFTTASLIVPPPAPFVSSVLPLFFSNTVVAIGANIGLAYEIGCDFSLVLTGELVANCGPRANSNIPFDFLTQSIFINPVLAPNSFIIGPIGTEIAIPLTIGLKYRF